jgi:DNA polymerase elongation subunit (family B)
MTKVVKVKTKFAYASFRLIEAHVKDVELSNIRAGEDESGSDDDTKQKRDMESFQIQLFGLNETGETASIYVNDFNPFFYVKVPYSWTIDRKDILLSVIRKRVGPFWEKSVLNATLIKRKKLYGFDGGQQHKFVKLEFKNSKVFNKVKNFWYTGSYGKDRKLITWSPKALGENSNLELYEANIPPLLRFFHLKEISPSGWVKISMRYATKYMNQTTCKYEFTSHHKNLKADNDNETQVPYKICSFDIEASSSHGDFPLPKKTYKKLAGNIVHLMNKWQKTGEFNMACEEFLKSCIRVAFFPAHENMSEIDPYNVRNIIDPIYVKGGNSLTFEHVHELINVLLKKQMREVRKQSDSSIEKYLTAASAAESLILDGQTDDFSASSYRAALKSKHRESTIIDMLVSKDLTTEEKIEQLDRTLTNIFPGVKGDKVTFIGSTFTRFGEDKPYLNHCAVLDTCTELPNLENSQIDSYKTEKEVLLAWTKLIQRENPDIIIGYNIFGFDYSFMFVRAQELKCAAEFLMMSRNRGEMCGKRDFESGQICIEESSIVIASGQHDLHFIKMQGRLQVDLYNYFRRSVNLEQYKLDYVAGHFIGDMVKSVEDTQNKPDYENVSSSFKITSKNLAGLRAFDFVSFEIIDHTSDKFEDGVKFQVQSVDKESCSFTIESNSSTMDRLRKNRTIRWCLAKDDVTPQDIFRLTNQGADERAIVAKYCIQDCNLVYELLKKIDIMTEFVEMANLCSVPINFLVMRGQGIKLTSYIAKKCREKGTLMPVIEKSTSDEGYEGAIVLEPKSGLYLEDPVACVDYSSLYPSSMISENLCHSSKVWTKEYDLEGNLIKETGSDRFDNMEGYKYVDVTYDTFVYRRKTPKAAAIKVKTGYKMCRFAQYPEEKGRAILPSVLEELLAARKATKRSMASEQDPFMKNVYDKRQLSIKLTANSLYGGTGAKTSTFYEPDVAASTTATGRKLLTYAKRVIEDVYGDAICDTKNYGKVRTNAKYIYGDTDSVFFCLYLKEMDGTPIKNKKALEITIELSQEVGAVATKFLKKPHDLEYEKTFLPFCLLSKKRYVGILHEFDPDKGKRKSMGIVLKRRDNAPIVKDVYGGIIDILMNEKDIQKSIEYMQQCLQNIVDKTYPMNKLMITKSLRSNYKNPDQIAHKVLADRIAKRDPGNKPKPGDRMAFVYIVNDNRRALQGEKIETPAFIEQNQSSVRIDYAHYISNQIMKPVLQVYALVLDQLPGFAKKMLKKRRFYKELEHQEKILTPEKYAAKSEQMKNKEVKALLFDKYLKMCDREKDSQQSIKNFFGKK